MKRKTHEQFVNDLSIKNKTLTLCTDEKYVHVFSKLKFMCDLGHIIEMTPDYALRGRKCNKCPKTPHKTHEQFVNDLSIKNKALILYPGEKYVHSESKLKFICNSKHIIETTPHYALSGA